MNPDAQMMVPISKANKDFSRVMHMVDSYGRVVIAQFASTDCPFRMSGAGSSVEAVWVSG